MTLKVTYLFLISCLLVIPISSYSDNTGSVSFDRTIYPLPIEDHPVSVYISINDPDFNTSSSYADNLALDKSPITINFQRGNLIEKYATAGGHRSTNVDIGPIKETGTNTGIFELKIEISSNFRPFEGETLRTGDKIVVEYNDPQDASGNVNTVTDSATFDFRNAVLQSDKSVYLSGSTVILTLIEPDLDFDSNEVEKYNADIIRWISNNIDTHLNDIIFNTDVRNQQTNYLTETGQSTGIFQTQIKIPDSVKLGAGEEIAFEYNDITPSRARYYGDVSEPVTLLVRMSNFGSTVELDQKVYSWRDNVYITVVAPDFNHDSNRIDSIGEKFDENVKIETKNGILVNYKLLETDIDSGIFTGQIQLTGFKVDSVRGPGDFGFTSGNGPNNGKIPATFDDFLKVTFQSDSSNKIGSANIRANIAEIQFLKDNYSLHDLMSLRVIDPDMNLQSDGIDSLDVTVSSDSDSDGILLKMRETGRTTGIFTGSITLGTDSSTDILKAGSGDQIVATYTDTTLPPPYMTSDSLEIRAEITMPGERTIRPNDVPQWIKTNAAWWSEGQISDDDFAKGIEYLIKENVIRIGNVSHQSQGSNNTIPEWIKSNANWWSKGLISDDDFIKGLEYMVKNGIIKI